MSPGDNLSLGRCDAHFTPDGSYQRQFQTMPLEGRRSISRAPWAGSAEGGGAEVEVPRPGGPDYFPKSSGVRLSHRPAQELS